MSCHVTCKWVILVYWPMDDLCDLWKIYITICVTYRGSCSIPCGVSCNTSSLLFEVLFWKVRSKLVFGCDCFISLSGYHSAHLTHVSSNMYQFLPFLYPYAVLESLNVSVKERCMHIFLCGLLVRIIPKPCKVIAMDFVMWSCKRICLNSTIFLADEWCVCSAGLRHVC